ncbi:expressed unknown protein [Seminavis robusta]|uniref:Uncharacterized protein n=1 Tax=Seminavis robusta TaxID=568900 RepID=A0A9N8DIZ6_9STRA|nr:expressed unknown protein [Seminavis robusta]|eukprot:Sro154_g070000.1 n/a (285) ;mRNA; r:39403-40257
MNLSSSAGINLAFSLSILVITTIAFEIFLFPSVTFLIGDRLVDHAERRNKAVMSIFVLLVRFLGFGTITIWQFAKLDHRSHEYQAMACGQVSLSADQRLTLWYAFTLHCSLFLVECFSPRFYLKQTPWSWLHHIVLWVNYVIYAAFKVEDPQAFSLGFLYGFLISFFAWNDVLQLLRYFSGDDYQKQYQYYRCYFAFKCVQFPAFIVVPCVWSIMLYVKGCLDIAAFAILITATSMLGIPDIFLLVTKMREILVHYREKQHHSAKVESNCVSTDSSGDNGDFDV